MASDTDTSLHNGVEHIQQVAVVGAGQMGNGITHVLAAGGYAVTMIDVSDSALARGVETITRNMDRQVKKGALAADAAVSRIDQVQVVNETIRPMDAVRGIRAAAVYQYRDELLVDVIHNADNRLVTRLTVDIEPWLRGRDWHDPVALTRAFAAVGAALTGS